MGFSDAEAAKLVAKRNKAVLSAPAGKKRTNIRPDAASVRPIDVQDASSRVNVSAKAGTKLPHTR